MIVPVHNRHLIMDPLDDILEDIDLFCCRDMSPLPRYRIRGDFDYHPGSSPTSGIRLGHYYHDIGVELTVYDHSFFMYGDFKFHVFGAPSIRTELAIKVS